MNRILRGIRDSLPIVMMVSLGVVMVIITGLNLLRFFIGIQAADTGIKLLLAELHLIVGILGTWVIFRIVGYLR